MICKLGRDYGGTGYRCIGGEKCVGGGFIKNKLKNFAGCNRWKSHLAIDGLRRVRYDNFAPCDSDESHLAMLAYHTLQHSSIAPCDSKNLLFGRLRIGNW